MIRAIAIAMLMLVGCGSHPATPASKPAPSTELRDSCATTDDCALVQACCGCSAGGRQLSIRKDSVADFEATRADRCRDQVCAQVMSAHPSCDAEPLCNTQGRCAYAAHMQHQ